MWINQLELNNYANNQKNRMTPFYEIMLLTYAPVHNRPKKQKQNSHNVILVSRGKKTH